MKAWIVGIILLALPAAAQALPGEDHWTVELDPRETAKLEESRQLIEEGRYCETLPALLELAEALPANADVFNMLGYVHRKMGLLEESGAHYARALYLKPDHRGALEYQGELFLLQGNMAAAQANLERLDTICAAGCEERDELAAAIRGSADN